MELSELLQRLAVLLDDIEYVEAYDGVFTDWLCPSCGSDKDDGHDEDCELAKLRAVLQSKNDEPNVPDVWKT